MCLIRVASHRAQLAIDTSASTTIGEILNLFLTVNVEAALAFFWEQVTEESLRALARIHILDPEG